MSVVLDTPKGMIMINNNITIIYFNFRKVLCVSILTVLFLERSVDKPSWIVPTGQIHPQKNLLVNKINNINIAKIKNGNFPSAKEWNKYSTNPAPFERGLRGEFRIGRAFTKTSKLFILIEKMASIIT